MVTTNNSATFEGAYFFYVVHALDMHLLTSETGIFARTRLTGMVSRVDRRASHQQAITRKRFACNRLHSSVGSRPSSSAARGMRICVSFVGQDVSNSRRTVCYEPRRKLLR